MDKNAANLTSHVYPARIQLFQRCHLQPLRISPFNHNHHIESPFLSHLVSRFSCLYPGSVVISLYSMGCGVSRPVIEDDAPVPPGLSPIRRRIEEIKRQRKTHKRSKSHLSSRELLEDDDRLNSHANDDHYEENGGTKSVSPAPLESIKELEQGGNPFEDKVEKIEVVVKLPPQTQIFENVGGNPVVEKAILAAKQDEEEQRDHHHHQQQQQQQHEDEEEDPDADEEGLWDYGSDIGPGSPSFREYCIYTPDHSADSDYIPKEDGKSDGEQVEERRQTEDSVGSSEGSANVLVKKGHKGRKFKRVIPKGGQAAMKNLLNVKSCYMPPCSSHHHSHSHSNPRLVMPSTTG